MGGVIRLESPINVNPCFKHNSLVTHLVALKDSGGSGLFPAMNRNSKRRMAFQACHERGYNGDDCHGLEIVDFRVRRRLQCRNARTCQVQYQMMGHCRVDTYLDRGRSILYRTPGAGPWNRQERGGRPNSGTSS
jgi:hypothetical protein